MSEYVITVEEQDFNLIHKIGWTINDDYVTIQESVIGRRHELIEILHENNEHMGWNPVRNGQKYFNDYIPRIDIKEYLKSKFCEILVEVYPEELDVWKDILINNLQLISDQYVSDPFKMIPIVIDKCKSSGEPAVFIFDKSGKYSGYVMGYNSHRSREFINAHYSDYLEMSFGEFNYHININSKELSLIDKLKQDKSNVGILINKYLIKNGDITKTQNNVIKFLEEYGNTI
jgi:hypothetical protein